MTQIEQEHTGLATLDTSTEAIEALLKDVTQGPWHVSIDDDGNPLSGRPSVQAAEELDCGIVHWDGFVQRFWRSARSDKEIQANARFIATSRELVPALLAERDALQAELARLKAQAVTVKPLAWKYHRDPRDTSEARTKIGTWTVWEINGSSYCHGPDDTCGRPCGETLEAAKAAAQADYEARILSAITARTEDVVWNEAVEAAAKITRRIIADGKICRSCGVVFDGVNHPHTDEDCVLGRASWDSLDNEALGAAVFEEIQTLKRPVKGESHE